MYMYIQKIYCRKWDTFRLYLSMPLKIEKIGSTSIEEVGSIDATARALTAAL